MVRLTELRMTQPMCAAIEALGRAMRTYVPGRDAASVIELPKLALADAVLAEVRAQLEQAAREGQQVARLARLETIRRPLPLGAVEVTIRHRRAKRRRA